MTESVHNLKCTAMPRNNTTDNLDERFDLRLDKAVREKLIKISQIAHLSKAEVIRRLIIQANPEDMKESA